MNGYRVRMEVERFTKNEDGSIIWKGSHIMFYRDLNESLLIGGLNKGEERDFIKLTCNQKVEDLYDRLAREIQERVAAQEATPE